MDPLSGILAAGGELIGGLFGSSGAQQQRNWEERMANTAYQRSTKDMLAAGLNPMMMYMKGGGGPATTPQGPNIGAPMGEGISAASAKMMEFQALKADVSQKENSALFTKKQADAVDTQVDLMKAQQQSTMMEVAYKAGQIQLNQALVALHSAQTAKTQVDMDLVKQEIAESLSKMNVNRALIQSYLADIRSKDVQTELARLTIPRAKILADAVQSGANAFTWLNAVPEVGKAAWGGLNSALHGTNFFGPDVVPSIHGARGEW